MKPLHETENSSTANVRQFRERLRARGLVKKDVWILPQFAAHLSRVEKSLRHPEGPEHAPELSFAPWTIDQLKKELDACPLVQEQRMTVERIDGVEPSLKLTMRDYGDLTILLAIASNQVLVETYLWPASAITDPSSFNACVLQTHIYLPLSKMCINDISGVRSYVLCGSLDACSSLNNILFELETLADNAFATAELYADFLQGDQS